MITTIIILAYIANVFLNRWLQYKLWKLDKTEAINWGCWFIPIAYAACLLILIIHNSEFKPNWFTGKYWK